MANDKLTYINIGPSGTFKKSGRVFATPDDINAILK